MLLYEQILKNFKVSPNQIYLLSCIASKRQPIFINVAAEKRGLLSLNLIDSSDRITQAGQNLLSKLPVEKLSKTKGVVVSADTLESNIAEYVKMFPKGKLPSGKQARVDKNNLKIQFNWFFLNYKYDWDTVFKATKLYIEEYEKKDFLYMRNSQYFISKMTPDKKRESELANYCNMVVTNDLPEDDSETNFSEKVV